MKNLLLFALPLCIVFVSCTKAPEKSSGEPSGEIVDPPVQVLYHPMLFVPGYQEVKKLREEVLTTRSSVWNNFKTAADKKMASVPSEYRTDTGEQLWQRDVGTNIGRFAFAGLVSEDQKYFDKARDWALKSCSYKTWGTDGTADGQEYGLAYGHQLLGLAMLYDYGQDNLTKEDVETIRNTMIGRCTRLYNAYKDASHNLLQNHTWINICGLLSSAIVLRNDTKAAYDWIDYSLDILEKASKILIKDGASQEGPGYWEYGIEFLLVDMCLAEYLGHDLWKNSNGWWKNTAYYHAYHTLPWNRCTITDAIIDWGDAPKCSWYGPEHLYRKLASLNQDPIVQYFAIKAAPYDVSKSFLNVLWHDPKLMSKVPQGNLPTSRLFDEMGIFATRTGWEGDETIFIFRAGAPLGKSASAAAGFSSGDMGHIHPDAGHFIIYANGEYILANNGYVKRRSIYHNTITVNNAGMWGQASGYFTPWPLTPSKYPSIVSAESTENMETVIADLSTSYQESALVSKHIRKVIFDKTENIAICCDDLEINGTSVPVKLRFYPGAKNGTLSGDVYLAKTGINNVRIENLTPDSGKTALGTEFIEERSTTDGTSVPVLTITTTTAGTRFVTAFSWGKIPSKAVTASYDPVAKVVSYNGKHINL